MNINTINNTFIKPPPPIFVKGMNDFSELYLALTEIIEVGNFMRTSITDHIQIQTTNPIPSWVLVIFKLRHVVICNINLNRPLNKISHKYAGL